MLLKRVKLTTCSHNNAISTTIFRYLINVVAYNFVNQLNQVIKGRNLKQVSNKTSRFFQHAKKNMQKNCMRKVEE